MIDLSSKDEFVKGTEVTGDVNIRDWLRSTGYERFLSETVPISRVANPTGSSQIVDVTNNPDIRNWLVQQGYGDIIKSPPLDSQIPGNFPSIYSYGLDDEMSRIRDSSGLFLRRRSSSQSSSDYEQRGNFNIDLVERHLKRRPTNPKLNIRQRHERRSLSSDRVNSSPESDDVVYKQRVFVRYLQPPTPEPPTEQIINQQQQSNDTRAPIIIRQHPHPSPPTPPPIIYRENPPPMPKTPQPIRVIRSPAPPPRPIIIERLPPPPPKQPDIIIERWLPPKKPEPRRIIIEQRNESVECEPIVQYCRKSSELPITIIDTCAEFPRLQQLCPEQSSLYLPINKICIPPQSVLNCLCPSQVPSCFSPCCPLPPPQPPQPQTINVFCSQPPNPFCPGVGFSGTVPPQPSWSQNQRPSFLNTQTMGQLGQQYVPPIRQSIQNVWDTISGGQPQQAPPNHHQQQQQQAPMMDQRVMDIGKQFIPSQRQSLGDIWGAMTSGAGGQPSAPAPPQPQPQQPLGAQFVPPQSQSLNSIWSTLTGPQQPQQVFPVLTPQIGQFQKPSMFSQLTPAKLDPTTTPFTSLLSSFMSQHYTPATAAALY